MSPHQLLKLIKKLKLKIKTKQHSCCFFISPLLRELFWFVTKKIKNISFFFNVSNIHLSYNHLAFIFYFKKTKIVGFFKNKARLFRKAKMRITLIFLLNSLFASFYIDHVAFGWASFKSTRIVFYKLVFKIRFIRNLTRNIFRFQNIRFVQYWWLFSNFQRRLPIFSLHNLFATLRLSKRAKINLDDL